MDPAEQPDAVSLLATLKQLTTESTSGSAKRGAKQQTSRQRNIFHTLHALRLAFATEGREQTKLCEQGTVDTFLRMVNNAEFHYMLTAAMGQVAAEIYVVLLDTLYSRPAVDALHASIRTAQARNAPRNVRLFTIICVGRAMESCGQQLRPLHKDAIGFLTKSLRVSEASIREGALVALERGVSGCGRFIAAHHKSIFQVCARVCPTVCVSVCGDG